MDAYIYIYIYIRICIYIFHKLGLPSRVLTSFVVIRYVSPFFQKRGLVGKGCPSSHIENK